MNTHEGYILNLIKRIDEEIPILKKEYEEKKLTFFDYRILQEKKFAERDILYRVLTAHDNPQSEFSILNNKKNDRKNRNKSRQ